MKKGVKEKKVIHLYLPTDLIEKINKDADEVGLNLTFYLRLLFRQPRPAISIEGASKERASA